VTNRTYQCTPPTGLPLTSHDWDSIDVRGTDHCCTVVVVVVVRPIVYDITRMGLCPKRVGSFGYDTGFLFLMRKERQ